MHCHVVPGVDDGSPDAATSADLVERMASWGITRIIATPHVTGGTFENTPDILDPALEELTTELRRRSSGVEVTRSAEFRIDALLRRLLDLGTVTPFPGNYLLVENSYHQEPPGLLDFLQGLRARGYRLILAHPERYLYYWRYNRQRYGEIYRSGIYLQVNVLSLAGYYGREERSAAEWLVEKGYVDFLGTDLHNHSHADAIEAYLASKAYARLAGGDALRLLNDRAFVPPFNVNF